MILAVAVGASVATSSPQSIARGHAREALRVQFSDVVCSPVGPDMGYACVGKSKQRTAILRSACTDSKAEAKAGALEAPGATRVVGACVVTVEVFETAAALTLAKELAAEQTGEAVQQRLEATGWAVKQGPNGLLKVETRTLRGTVQLSAVRVDDDPGSGTRVTPHANGFVVVRLSNDIEAASILAALP